MLTVEEQARFLDSIARVQESAARRLSAGDGPSFAIEFVSNLHHALDKVVARARDRGQSVDCKSGCAFCCSVRVEATWPEALRIVRELRKRSPNEINSIVERLREHAAALKNDQTNSHRITCVFLENCLCTIYEVRPSTCRRAHSISVKHCETFASEIPQDLTIALEAEALMIGTSSAYRRVGLDATPHELSDAVLSVLDDGAAETRWYNGELRASATSCFGGRSVVDEDNQ